MIGQYIIRAVYLNESDQGVRSKDKRQMGCFISAIYLSKACNAINECLLLCVYWISVLVTQLSVHHGSSVVVISQTIKHNLWKL